MHIPPAPQPDPAELDAFWREFSERVPGIGSDAEYQVRWIGLDHETTEQILELIESGDKTGTFTLPWVIERSERPTPQVGDFIVLIDFAAKPRLVVRLTKVYDVAFGDVTEADTVVDGPPVRSLDVWKPLHTQYWNAMLAPHGLAVSDDMPVLVEAFEVVGT